MTDQETISSQQELIEKLKRKIKRLEKRLLEKKKYELEDLLQKGATSRFIAKIDEKDQKAMSD